MATIIPIGEPANDAERRAIAHLRDHLPSSYVVFHNFEIHRDGESFEVDLAVLSPHALYLVDVKGTRGPIDVYGPKWYPEGRQPFTSPLLKLRSHARTVKGILTESQPGRRDLDSVFVDAVVLLTAPDANLVDPGARDIGNVTTLGNSVAFFQNTGRIPARFERNISRLHAMVRSAVVGVARKRSGPMVLGDWKVVERLGASDTFTEYRAVNTFAGKRGGTALLRVYQADPYLTNPEERERQRLRIGNAFHALNKLPGHPFIAGVKNFFATEGEDRYVLVTEDVPGQALRLHIDKPALALTLDQKLRVARELLEALAFCHAHDVVHRDLSPSTILLGNDGHIRLIGFDHARAGTDRTFTIAGEIVEKVDENYSAPESWKDPANASSASDVFGAGLVLFELFASQRPFESPTELFDRGAVFPMAPTSLRPEVSDALSRWLQSLCAFEATLRPTAKQALEELNAILGGEPTHLDGADFIDQALAISSGELRPILDLFSGLETEQIEFKEALYNTKELRGANLADVQWAIARTLVALANSSGGALLIGVRDDAQPVGLAPSDPKRRLESPNGWDEFIRKELSKALFRENGWATEKRGTWRVDVGRLQTQVVPRRATLDGVPVLALIVRPSAARDLLLASNERPKTEPTVTLFVRAAGDKGEVIALERAEEHERWNTTRRVRSPVFAAHLERLKSFAIHPPAGKSPDKRDYDWKDLPTGHLLNKKLEIQRRLGSGNFGVVYEVVDTLGDVKRALKLILRDKHSTLERLKKEYKTLVHLPEHPHVVRVVDANVLEGDDGPPYMLFEYVEGEDLGGLIGDGRFAPEDALLLFRQVAEGLAHLHREGVYHCDIKPHNLLWTVRGAKIIDFNVSVRSEDNGHGGGSRRYLPPDLDLSAPPSRSELVDRDLYALGLTVYEAITGTYPWKSSSPPPATPAPDPREWPGRSDLAPEFVSAVLKAIAPMRANRFASASALIEALENVARARRDTTSESSDALLAVPELGGAVPPNTNRFVSYLLTLYSQSSQTNAGTRGLDDLGRRTYVPTLLDSGLMPDVLAGKFKLVVITGNAGDGKTAFLQQLEAQAGEQAQLVSSEALLNGRRFATEQRTFLTNYDGSQDEDDRGNGEVLREFFAPFSGDDPAAWTDTETRLVAVNEGRLVDFLQTERAQFPALLRLVEEGLRTGADNHGVAVVNLNLRSVVARGEGLEDSILRRQLRVLTHPKFWQACQECDLKDKCYALHNAQTFQDRTAGPQVLERLETLYTLTHLRGRLHITLRDLRSALAFMLTSARDCAEIHRIYAAARRDEIAAGFYFNAWMGAESATIDRLLTLLQDVDVGASSDPRMDRTLDFVSPSQDRSRFGFADRGGFDHEVLRALYEALPRDFSGKPMPHRTEAHRRYVAMARRRAFFERRDGGWRSMLPYRSADRMLRKVRGEARAELALPDVLQAINRGEGLLDPTRLGEFLALQVRQVERGTIRSYRLYDMSRFQLVVRDAASRARFVEHMPDALVLRFADQGNNAELVINLDVFEMLDRLNHGYRPSLEDEQGYYLSLAVFKNVLGSAPYQEVLLTTTGHDFYRIERHKDGRLEMTHVATRVSMPTLVEGAVEPVEVC